MAILLEQITLHPRRVAAGEAAEFLPCQSRARLQKGKGTSRQILEPRFAELSFETASEVAGQRRATKIYCKLFQNSAVSLQAFPKKALAILWDFKGLQGLKIK
jgi:hypothetical protein